MEPALNVIIHAKVIVKKPRKGGSDENRGAAGPIFKIQWPIRRRAAALVTCTWTTLLNRVAFAEVGELPFCVAVGPRPPSVGEATARRFTAEPTAEWTTKAE